MYTISDHAKGSLFDLDKEIGFEPAVQKILVECGAAYLCERKWLTSPRRADELAAAIDAWLADGRPDNGLPKGSRSGISITHIADGYYAHSAPRSMNPALKRMGVSWNSANKSWQIPATIAKKFEELVARSSADAEAAREEKWPEIPGVSVTVRPDTSLAVQSPFDPEIKNAIKSVPTARWDPDRRVWVVMAKYRAALRKALTSVSTAAEAAKQANDERRARAAGLRRIMWSESGAQVTVKFDYDVDIIRTCRNLGLRWNASERTWGGKMRHESRDALLERFIELEEQLFNPALKGKQ